MLQCVDTTCRYEENLDPIRGLVGGRVQESGRNGWIGLGRQWGRVPCRLETPTLSTDLSPEGVCGTYAEKPPGWRFGSEERVDAKILSESIYPEGVSDDPGSCRSE